VCLFVSQIDIRLLPVLSILYLLSQVDRGNIANAKIEGLDTELGLGSLQWSLVLSMFWIPYILFGGYLYTCPGQGQRPGNREQDIFSWLALEIPSNMILKSMRRPSIYLGVLVTAGGCVMIGHAFVRNFAQLALARILLGVLE
jgi:MFS family permease